MKVKEVMTCDVLPVAIFIKEPTLKTFDIDFKVVEVMIVQASPSTDIVISCIEAFIFKILKNGQSRKNKLVKI